MLYVGGDRRPGHEAGLLKALEGGVIERPCRPPVFGNLVRALKLSRKKGCSQLARQERRAYFDPSVLVDLPLQILIAIGAFLPDDARTFGDVRAAGDQSTAFAGRDILRGVKREAADVTQAAGVPSIVRR